MHVFLELLPLIGLVGGYFIGKSVNADAAMYYLSYGAIIGTLLQFFVYKLRKQKMQKMTLITGIVLMVFASMTIIAHNDLFIKLKPTVLSWAFCLGFWAHAFFKKQTLLELMMAEQFELPAAKWQVLNWAWIGFNFVVGLANLIVVKQIISGNWNNDSWVNFKMLLFPVSLVFIVGQTIYLFRHGKAKVSKT